MTAWLDEKKNVNATFCCFSVYSIMHGRLAILNKMRVLINSQRAIFNDSASVGITSCLKNMNKARK